MVYVAFGQQSENGPQVAALPYSFTAPVMLAT